MQLGQVPPVFVYLPGDDGVMLVRAAGNATAGLAALTLLLASMAGSRLISSMLFGVNPFDPIAYLGAAIVLGTVAIVTCSVPARRAARLDPRQSLRSDT